jgi:hypothetical protein
VGASYEAWYVYFGSGSIGTFFRFDSTAAKPVRLVRINE